MRSLAYASGNLHAGPHCFKVLFTHTPYPRVGIATSSNFSAVAILPQSSHRLSILSSHYRFSGGADPLVDIQGSFDAQKECRSIRKTIQLQLTAQSRPVVKLSDENS